MSGEVGGWVRERGGGPPHSRTLRAFGGVAEVRAEFCVQSSGALGGRPPASVVRQNFNQRTRWPGWNRQRKNLGGSKHPPNGGEIPVALPGDGRAPGPNARAGRFVPPPHTRRLDGAKRTQGKQGTNGAAARRKRFGAPGTRRAFGLHNFSLSWSKNWVVIIRGSSTVDWWMR
jgi:hypothetical protein